MPTYAVVPSSWQSLRLHDQHRDSLMTKCKSFDRTSCHVWTLQCNACYTARASMQLALSCFLACLTTVLMCSFSAQMKTKPTGHSLGRGRAARRGPGSMSEQLVVGPLQPEQQSTHTGRLHGTTIMPRLGIFRTSINRCLHKRVFCHFTQSTSNHFDSVSFCKHALDEGSRSGSFAKWTAKNRSCNR